VSGVVPAAATPHVTRIRVYYEDTDMAGIVYYANYLRFIERARSDWVRDLGIDQLEMKRAGVVPQPRADGYGAGGLARGHAGVSRGCHDCVYRRGRQAGAIASNSSLNPAAIGDRAGVYAQDSFHRPCVGVA